MLADAGYGINSGVAGLPTAFVATLGDGPLVVGICAEFDALPGIGHACGHNIIAGSAVAAALALAPLVSRLGITVKVFGTPAEENGGGKAIMIDAGNSNVAAARRWDSSPPSSVLCLCSRICRYRSRAWD